MLQVEDKTGSPTQGTLAVHLTEQELIYASQAANEFNKNNFDACLAAISKLKSSRSFDIKVILNHAVAEYYQSGLTKTDQFKSILQELRTKITSEESSGTTEDEDYCLVHYNYAVILFHCKQYSSAIAVLEKLQLENMDEPILGKIFFLLMDSYIASYQLQKALNLAGMFEKVLGSPKVVSSSESHVESLTDKHHVLLVQNRMKCYMMLRQIDFAKKEVKLLTQNTASNVLLKANFELLKQNYQKSVNMLNSCLASWKKAKHLTFCYNNNVGVSFFNMKKYSLAHLHFAKAVEEKSALWKSFSKSEATKGSLSGPPVDVLGNKKHFEMLYNIGVTLLHCGQAQQAFDCLLSVVQVYHFNPRLWLRLAECSVMVHKKRNDEDCAHEKKMQVLKGYAGSSFHRKGLLGRGVHSQNSNVKDSSAIPLPTMGFAALCLENALNCLDNSKSMFLLVEKEEQQDGLTDSNSTLLLSVAPSSPVSSAEVNSLRCSILALKAYVALHHKNFLAASNAVDTLLQQPALSGVHRYLSQMYKAEALLGLNKLSESLNLLSNEDAPNLNIFSPDNDEITQIDSESTVETKTHQDHKNRRWYPYTVDQAKSIRLFNSAVVHTVKKEFDKAKSYLEQSFKAHKGPYFAQMYYLKIYLQRVETKKSCGTPQQTPCILSMLTK